jgi:hypothetical protein
MMQWLPTVSRSMREPTQLVLPSLNSNSIPPLSQVQPAAQWQELASGQT